MSDLPVIATFWHGPMSWLERLSLASFVRQGHPVHLYSYDPQPALAGVTPRDAADVVPRERLVFYKGRGTPGVFSDLFRMSILRQQRGIWADADVICVRPIPQPRDYLFAFERRNSVNGAVLWLPHDCALLDDLLGIFAPGRARLLEPHLPPFRRAEVALRRLLGQKVPPEYMQYGATGPFALTYFVRRHGLWDRVLPSTSFYPVPYQDVPQLLRPGFDLQAAMREDTFGIHVWRSALTARGARAMPVPLPGSPLAELCRAHGITVQSAVGPVA